MKLDELHVGNFSSGAVSHGNAVSCGNLRVGGIGVDVPETARRKHGNFCKDFYRFSLFRIKHVGPITGDVVCFDAEMMLRKQFNGKMVFKQSNIGMAVDSIKQRSFNLPTCQILCMDDAAS